jgi:8-oxo-dGTP pyrophosphatase MutT (NUDIX family)
MRIAPPLTPPLDRLASALAAEPAAIESSDELVWAAVAVVLLERPAPAGPALLLVRRAERPGDPWSGHMGLPGGRRDGADADLLDTAIRETREEVGVGLSRAELIGSLDDVAPRSPVLPPIAVRPFVFVLRSEPVLALDAEIAAAGWVSLARLLDPAVYRTVEVEIRGGRRLTPAYVTDAGIVWGMTERILTPLLDRLR